MRVIYDLTQSHYTSNYKNLEFYFSSAFYKSKFDKGLEDYQNKTMLRLSIDLRVDESFLLRFGIDIILAISFYHKVEKRGSRFLQK